MKHLRWLILFLSLVLMPSIAPARSLVIIGWDGAGSNNVIPLLEQGRLPNLQAFIDRGANYLDVETIGKTCTIPTWASIFTGLSYDQHKITSNTQVYRRIPWDDIIFSQIKAQGYKIGWFVSKWYVLAASGVHKQADAYIKMEDRILNWNDNYLDRLQNGAISFIQSNTDFVLFLHLNPDHYGHLYGENSERYLQEFMRCDAVFGNILSVIDADTRVIVLSDHGFDEDSRHHDNAPDLWMVTDLPVDPIFKEIPPTTRDIAMTILDYFGITNWREDPAKYRGKSLMRLSPGSF